MSEEQGIEMLPGEPAEAVEESSYRERYEQLQKALGRQGQDQLSLGVV